MPVLKVKTADNDWVAVGGGVTGGSSSGVGLSLVYSVGATPPSDTRILWIDSGNSNILKFYNGSAWVAVGAV